MSFVPDRGVSPYDNFDKLKASFPLGGEDIQNSAITTDKIADGDVTAGKLAALEAWRVVGTTGQPAFAGTWANFGSGFNSAAFRKDAYGRVWLRGLVKSGSGTIFTLPTGYRPLARHLFIADGTDAIARVDVLTDGTVSLVTGTGTTDLSLDHINFSTD